MFGSTSGKVGRSACNTRFHNEITANTPTRLLSAICTRHPKNAVADAQDSITRGSTIAAPLRRSGEFPALVTHMISVGEASGELEDMLAKVADTYDELVDNSLNRLTTLMGPILLVLVAGLVVLIIVSTLLPLLSLTAAL